ncbi:hypothetical protein glysoja_043099 [Glycine soja]|uniref:Uncharacterized protein n=1 Tax=Glycine soja TaxID=3848 RepID=A0A0B2RDY3_GLYSO|nr:hypothetical protein glysoja_043099 [Glycine soja]
MFQSFLNMYIKPNQSKPNVAALKEDGCPKVWVVTSDHCHQQAAHGAGAFIWSCKALVTEKGKTNLTFDSNVRASPCSVKCSLLC